MAGLALGRQNVDGATAIVRSFEQPLLLQVRDVLVHRGQGLEIQPPGDLIEGRGVSILFHEAADEIDHFFLSACNGHAAIVAKKQRNVAKKSSPRSFGVPKSA